MPSVVKLRKLNMRINKINVKLKQFKFDGEFSQFFSGVKYKSERIADKILSLKVNKEVAILSGKGYSINELRHRVPYKEAKKIGLRVITRSSSYTQRGSGGGEFGKQDVLYVGLVKES
jgi:hypothetical protein